MFYLILTLALGGAAVIMVLALIGALVVTLRNRHARGQDSN